MNGLMDRQNDSRKKRLLIVDGNNLLFQMFYGLPAKIYNSSGQTIHATIGFISFILRQVRDLELSHVAVVFDRDAATERLEQYEDYKANRTVDWDSLPEDEVPFNEEEKIERCLEFLGIKTFHSQGMEADDIVSTLALRFKNVCPVVISSFDSDFFQLIDDNVSVLRARGKNNTAVWDCRRFEDEFGFPPARYPFYKALVGDSSDNIRGVDGIGKKRGCFIASKVSGLDELDCLDNERLYNSVIGSIDIVKRNLDLITLRQREEVQCSLEELSFNVQRCFMTNSQVLSECGIFD